MYIINNINNIMDLDDAIIISQNNIKKKKSKKIKGKLYCSNCGKIGHVYKNCTEPIISFGVINFLILTDDTNVVNRIENELSINDGLDNDGLDNDGLNNDNKYDITTNSIGIKIDDDLDIKTFSTYVNNIKFLMIRRKHSLGYVEFIRGRYNVENVDGIIFLFRQMTSKEITRIGANNFDYLWNNLWHSNKYKNNYQNEYNISKNKFNKLKYTENEESLNLKFYIENITPTWENAEWGFPKGRRNSQESDIMCAIREFQEESGFKDGEYVVLDKICPIHENLIGTNGIHYKHIYYPTISVTDRTPFINIDNRLQSDEIGDIGWFTYEESINLIRPHHIDRKKLLSQLYTYIINVIINIEKNKMVVHQNV
jgi:8-oxo-dGTP pyrophosphatase MutT (NUDIX family)